MPNRKSVTGSELFIVDNSDEDWKVLRYLHDWCQISKSIDIATGYLEIGALLGLKDEWQKVNQIRILMGDEVSLRTRDAFVQGLARITGRLDGSLEGEKHKNDFLAGVPAIVEAIRSGKIACRVCRKDRFHAKAYITHARLEVVGSSALVGSSNMTLPGLTENVELNVQITGRPVTVLQEWYEEHWKDAEPVTEDILRAIERHVHEYMPFDVYAKSLHEFFRRHVPTDEEWLRTESRMYRVLDQYQKEGFHDLMRIAQKHQGAFLCDSVGLGKTFIGLMAIEYLCEKERQRVVLLVPKATRKPVWEAAIHKYLPGFRWADSNLLILNHTDLLRQANPDCDYPALLQHVKEAYDTIMVDEAHHFRNPGLKGEEGERKSHYWQLFDIADGKSLFMLTATPVNNRLIDLQHMMELFSRRQPDYFKDAPLGIHSLPGHFRKMENELERLVLHKEAGNETMPTDLAEAEKVLSNDDLFRALVVQRSRAYVKKSQSQHGSAAQTVFPTREDPKVAEYSMKKTYGNLLTMIEQAFNKTKPLFSLAVYYPLFYYIGPDKTIDPLKEGRQLEVVSLIRIQFLKRFESSARAFEMSCETLLQRLFAWVVKNNPTGEELRRFERWKAKHGELIGYAQHRQLELFAGESEEEPDDDVVMNEMIEDAEELSRDDYKVDEIIAETIDDLHQLGDFLVELKKFKPAHDDKLKALVKLLKTDPVLKKHKILIFSEYMATARYLKQQLEAQGITAVDEVDSASKRDRGDIIRQFAPYYNGSSSAELAAQELPETRILISTDVLSEGLNLQDATRLINYDIHWNPVRLMQRIGCVDRRLNPDMEARILADHPEQAGIRRNVAFWNFLPPKELEVLLRLYNRVSHKTLRISKTFGIEGKKLLRPEDDFEALKDFTHAYEGQTTPLEELRLEYQGLLERNPGLLDRITALPGRVFSGKAHPSPNAKAIFFCFALPAPPVPTRDQPTGPDAHWTEGAGDTTWYLFDLSTEKITEEPTEIVKFIRCAPDTPRKHDIPNATLSDIRVKVEKHIKNTYLKQVQAPIGVKPVLKAWMELS